VEGKVDFLTFFEGGLVGEGGEVVVDGPDGEEGADGDDEPRDGGFSEEIVVPTNERTKPQNDKRDEFNNMRRIKLLFFFSSSSSSGGFAL